MQIEQQQLTDELKRRIFRLVFGVGVGHPWIIAIAVKVWLQAHGRPTLSVLYFLHPLSLLSLIPISLWLGFPYILLAFLCRWALNKGAFFEFSSVDKLIVIASGALFGIASTASLYWGMFVDFDPLALLEPVPLYYGHYVLYGLATGLLVVGGRVLFKKAI